MTLKKTKKIKGLFNIQLGSIYLSENTNFFNLKHPYIKDSNDIFNPISSVYVNIDPLNKKIFQIYAILRFPELSIDESQQKLRSLYSKFREYFIQEYEKEFIQIDSVENFVVHFDDKTISLNINNNQLLIECTDQIIRHNCYALFISNS